MRSIRDLRMLNYHAAQSECRARGLPLPYWPGDEDVAGHLLLPLGEPCSRADGARQAKPDAAPSLALVPDSDGQGCSRPPQGEQRAQGRPTLRLIASDEGEPQ